MRKKTGVMIISLDENVTENKISLDNLSRTEDDYQDAIKQLKIEKLTLSAFDNQDRIEEIDDEIKST